MGEAPRPWPSVAEGPGTGDWNREAGSVGTSGWAIGELILKRLVVSLDTGQRLLVLGSDGLECRGHLGELGLGSCEHVTHITRLFACWISVHKV